MMVREKLANEELLPSGVKSYLTKHNVHNVVVSAMNQVLKDMPEDPFGHLAATLAKHASSCPRFIALQSSIPRSELLFDVVVNVQGVRLRLHTVSLKNTIVDCRRCDGDTTAETGEVVVAGAEWLKELDSIIAFVEKSFSAEFASVSVKDLLSLDQRCARMVERTPEGTWAFDLAPAVSTITDSLFEASIRALNMTSLEFIRATLVDAGLAAFTSPPIHAQSDLERLRWPHMALPVIHGGGPSAVRPASLRCCVAFTHVSQPAKLSEVGAGVPPVGWVPASWKALRQMPLEMAKLLQSEKGLGSLVVEGVPHCHPEGLAHSMRLARKAGEVVANQVGQPGATSGVLLAAADEAWVESAGVYEFETGKPLSLKQLVELYTEMSEDGWLRTIVQPFRLLDAATGCELLRANRPELHLAMDCVTASPGEGGASDCFLRLGGTVPSTLRQVVEQIPRWRGVGGFGRCLLLDGSGAPVLPQTVLIALALQEADTICFAPHVDDEDILRMGTQVDEVMHRATFAGLT